MNTVYTDDAPYFAARKYPGCFTVEEVRRHLGHGAEAVAPAEEVTVLPEAAHELGQWRESAMPGNHFLLDCVCAPLHAACTGLDRPCSDPDGVDITIERLRHSAKRGCWFCSVVHNGITTAPPWDPQREERIPLYPRFRMPAKKQKYDGPDFFIDPFGDNNHPFEPKLVYYVDQHAGKPPALT